MKRWCCFYFVVLGERPSKRLVRLRYDIFLFFCSFSVSFCWLCQFSNKHGFGFFTTAEGACTKREMIFDDSMTPVMRLSAYTYRLFLLGLSTLFFLFSNPRVCMKKFDSSPNNFFQYGTHYSSSTRYRYRVTA